VAFADVTKLLMLFCHQCAEISLWGLDDQMVVVCHQNKGVKDSSVLVESIHQIGEELLVVAMG